MLKHRLIRAMLGVATIGLSSHEPGKAPIPFPNRFRVFNNLPEDFTLRGLAKGYQEVFGEPPWGEEWPEQKVLAKLRRELTGDCFLTLMVGNEEWPVAGFSWGSLLPVGRLEAHIEAALEKRPRGLDEALRKRGVERLVYFHEFAVLRQFRGGIDPLRFLLQPGLEIGWARGVRQTMFWSTLASKIVPLSLYMGYEPIFRLEAGGKEIVFLFNSNFLPLLKIVQNLNPQWISLIMVAVSRILGTTRKAGI